MTVAPADDTAAYLCIVGLPGPDQSGVSELLSLPVATSMARHLTAVDSAVIGCALMRHSSCVELQDVLECDRVVMLRLAVRFDQSCHHTSLAAKETCQILVSFAQETVHVGTITLHGQFAESKAAAWSDGSARRTRCGQW